ncbi:lysine transporter LysE [Marinosulfonomonas sp. PRT-SC04]|nr:lysine transporter LysE [Marinosulfonomonas sp. PRT-SC04]
MLDPLYIFVFAGLFSPGPNVIMLTTSGAEFGLRRTLPHLFGVVLGVGVIAGLTGLGIGTLLIAYPQLDLTLRSIAAIWILWMAFQLWMSTMKQKSAQRKTPFTFLQAALFQWVNPKIWAVALTASSGYSIGLSPSGEALRLVVAFSGLNLFVCLFWTSAGSLLAYLLTRPNVWRGFMRVMALALAATAVMVFL